MINSPINLPFGLSAEVIEKQRTDKWYRARWGKITSSRLSDINKPKGLGETGINYLNSLLYQRICGEPTEMQIQNMEQDMSWEVKNGKKYEPEARERIGKQLGVTIEECEFKPYPGLEMSGDSSDGIFQYQGVTIPVEIKSTAQPNTSIKRMQLVTEKHGDFYQIQGHMLAWEAPFAIYAVFDYAANKLDWQVVMRSEIHIEKIIASINSGNELIAKALRLGLRSVADDENMVETYRMIKQLPILKQ